MDRRATPLSSKDFRSKMDGCISLNDNCELSAHTFAQRRGTIAGCWECSPKPRTRLRKTNKFQHIHVMVKYVPNASRVGVWGAYLAARDLHFRVVMVRGSIGAVSLV